MKSKTIEEIKENFHLLISDVLEDWSETQFNIESKYAREMLADAIVHNIFNEEKEEENSN